MHHFDYALDLAWAWKHTLADRYRDTFVELVRSWVHAGVKSDGWEPYPLSIRLVNWFSALALFGTRLSESDRHLIERSLYQQALYLAARIEWHLDANHVLKNLVALAYTECLFGDNTTKGVLKHLWKAVDEQLLRDGGHYERSPMYHALIYTDLVLLIDFLRRCGHSVPASVVTRIRRMTDAAAVWTRLDGSWSLFNDSANGVALSPALLGALSERLGWPPLQTASSGQLLLPDSGFYGWIDRHAGERLLVTCASPSPAHQPAHSHCDVLSFELDLCGVQFVVDSGVRGYEGDPLREYARSTRAHNTVEVCGKEQSELWATFRFGRRARVRGIRASIEPCGRYKLCGSYSPYFASKIVHTRMICRSEGRWLVRDRLTGDRDCSVRGALHIHPSWSLERADESWVARRGEMTISIKPFASAAVECVRGVEDRAQGWYSPEFGVAVPAPTLILTADICRGSPTTFGYTIEPLSRVRS